MKYWRNFKYTKEKVVELQKHINNDFYFFQFNRDLSNSYSSCLEEYNIKVRNFKIQNELRS